jgi:hypothetical protein
MDDPNLTPFDWLLSEGDKSALVALLYIRMSNAINQNLELLQRNRRRGSLAYVAWLTRNLLELRVWAEYCALSMGHAQDFFFDSIRDLADVNRMVDDLDDETKEQLEKAKNRVGNKRPATNSKT